MNTPLNEFLKFKHPRCEFDVAFFSNPRLPEEACGVDSESYLVMIDRKSDVEILLTLEGEAFRLTSKQASVLGMKLLEIASPEPHSVDATTTE